MYKAFLKRCFDFTASFLGLLLLLPLLLVMTLALTVANNGNPFFVQARPGRHGKIFRIVKFRTMNNKTDANGELLPDSERLTKVGSFVRRTSLDEIPQLVNVLTGDMSLIGPRPLLTRYLSKYNAFQNRRHEVRPGITGWAQVNGRNAISWDKKFEYDVYYVDNLGFALDCKILVKTVLKVVKSEGINAADQATVEPFS